MLFRSGELIALLDGVEVETTTTEIASAQRGTPVSTGRLIIGGMGQESYFDPLSGHMDNVKIYYETLTQQLDSVPFEFISNSAVIDTDTYSLHGTAETINNEILSIQHRLYDSEQTEGENWNSCTCDDGTCNSINEDFTCNITAIPDSTSTYEIRLGYGDPLQ